ncbi:MAG TPA: DUF1697 domain-containing protein [Phycisphaerae bacterium]|nr:DUF1697 domain-containing protein [Phycisphaerae bacterium]
MKPKASQFKGSAAAMHVALLRGINVGGKHMLPMSDLVGMFVDAGCKNVQTYIQSGNVVFAASNVLVKRLPGAIGQQIAKRFGFQPCVIIRSADEIARVAAAHPFSRPGTDEKLLHVGFLERAPADSLIARLDPARSPGDRFTVKDKEIYLHFPNGVHKSKLTNAYIDSMLTTTSTIRNWRTVLKVADMTG